MTPFVVRAPRNTAGRERGKGVDGHTVPVRARDKVRLILGIGAFANAEPGIVRQQCLHVRARTLEIGLHSQAEARVPLSEAAGEVDLALRLAGVLHVEAALDPVLRRRVENAADAILAIVRICCEMKRGRFDREFRIERAPLAWTAAA